MNARDALPDGGEVVLKIAPVRIDPGTGVPGRYVMVEVSDRGVGRDERSGGFVRLDSTPGQGTTVRAFFPRVGASSGETTEYTALGRE